MVLENPLYMQDLKYPARVDRVLVESLASAGPIGAGSLLVSERAAGTNMSVDVAAGTCVIPGTDTAAQGSYLCRSTAVVNVPLDAAPGAGNSRRDRIVARVHDGQVLGDSTNEWTPDVVTGTPAPSPLLPTLPDSCIDLARVLVTSGTAAITNAMIEDRRVFSKGNVPDGSVGTPQLTDDAVTLAKLDPGVGATLRGVTTQIALTNGDSGFTFGPVSVSYSSHGFTSSPILVPLVLPGGTGYRNQYTVHIVSASATSATFRLSKLDGGANSATTDTNIQVLIFADNNNP
jgi:hypothetical protein